MYSKLDNQPSLNGPAEYVELFKSSLARNTSRIFVVLMPLQWVGAILTALIVSPYTWSGAISSVHVHVWAALLLGGLITAVPVALAAVYPTEVATRHVIAAGQMLMSALLIHVTGGRVETHFHVFGSLALLAFYRDWRILITAAIIVYFDHAIRGYYWPQSVYGVLNASAWRAVEHAWWVGFEVVFLCIAIRQSTREMFLIAERQAKLQSLNSEIEAQVKERTAELRTINQQMETFCYSMSHDLKAPLRGIHMCSQILAEDHGGELSGNGQDCVSRIQEAAARMNRLVNDLLEYSRVSTAKLVLGPVDLSSVTQEAIHLLAAEIQEQEASIDVKPDLGVVLGHEATLLQVMLNLLSNALKYRRPDVALMLHIRSECQSNRVRISVKDNGIGVAPQYHKKIFEIFERIPTHSSQASTGVGLAIVAKSIERLRGSVGIASKPGAGSVFWFELPKATLATVNDSPEIVPSLVLS
jgi:signal transduction histidine kinase